VYELFRQRLARWRSPGFYIILVGMRSITRGLITTIVWMGLALGVTSALSSVLQGRHGVDTPADARSVIR